MHRKERSPTCSRAWALQLLKPKPWDPCSATGEATAMRSRPPRPEKAQKRRPSAAVNTFIFLMYINIYIFGFNWLPVRPRHWFAYFFFLILFANSNAQPGLTATNLISESLLYDIFSISDLSEAKSSVKNATSRTSLVVQLLRLCFHCGGMGLIPDWRTKIPQAHCVANKKINK